MLGLARAAGEELGDALGGLVAMNAYLAGAGILDVSLLGLIPLVRVPQTPELAQGELLRWLVEAVWYPTALLPSQGVRWEPVDDASARATIIDGPLAATLLFRFADTGLVASVRAEGRGRMVAGKVVPTPWEGRWWHYVLHDGLRVPLEGEVAWLLPSGRQPYWRGRVTQLSYGFAGSDHSSSAA